MLLDAYSSKVLPERTFLECERCLAVFVNVKDRFTIMILVVVFVAFFLVLFFSAGNWGEL